MAYALTSKPEATGKIAPTSGTPLSLTSNLTGAYGNTDPSNDLWANKISVSTLSSNAGKVYVMKLGGSRSTLAGVLAVLTPGQSWATGDYSRSNTYHAGAFYIDVDTTGDYCYGSIDVV